MGRWIAWAGVASTERQRTRVLVAVPLARHRDRSLPTALALVRRLGRATAIASTAAVAPVAAPAAVGVEVAAVDAAAVVAARGLDRSHRRAHARVHADRVMNRLNRECL